MIGELFRAMLARNMLFKGLPAEQAQDQQGKQGKSKRGKRTAEHAPAAPRSSRLLPGDKTIVDRCHGPTLDIGSGSGRLAAALGERGIPALGIDPALGRNTAAGRSTASYAVGLTRTTGPLTLVRDVFEWLPGTGRWTTVLLADEAIGIGDDPVTLLRRAGELLTPPGQVLVEVRPPARLQHRRDGGPRGDGPDDGPSRTGQDRAGQDRAGRGYVGADQITDIAREAGLTVAEAWSSDGRWFAALLRARALDESALDGLLPASVPGSPQPLFAFPPLKSA